MKRLYAELQRALKGFLWGTAVGLLLIAALYLNLCPAERSHLNDFLYPSSDKRAPVAVVLVGEEALHRYGHPEGWSAEQHQALLHTLRQAGARVIALTFPAPPGAEEALASLENPGDIVLPVLGAGPSRTAEGRLLYPYLVGPTSGRFSPGHINLLPDADGVLRRIPLWIGGPGRTVPALAWQAGARYLDADIPAPTGRAFGWEGHLFTPDPAGRVLFYPSSAPIPTYRLEELTAPTTPPDLLGGSIVFVGLETAERAETYRTPTGEMDEAHVHAQAATALMLGLTLTPVPAVTAALTLTTSLLAGWMMARLRRALPLAAGLLSLAGGILLISHHLYRTRFQVDVLPPLAGLLLSGLLTALWRSREEHRRERLLRSLQGRLSPHLLTHLITRPESERILAADIRFVAVLFADVRGFVRLTEGQDPRKIQETINAHLAQFTQAIVDSGGVVIKYIGDMVAAVFNAPVSIDRPVDQALCAALEGLRRLRELWARNPDMVRMPMGVGIHAGNAVVGLLGPLEHPEYDAIGDTVNVAARLSTYAPAGEIYVTEAVVATVKQNWRFEPVGTLRLRGRYEPVIVYRLREPTLHTFGGESFTARFSPE